MKKILLVAVALSLAFTVKAFATETKKATEVKPATTATQIVKTTEPAKAATTTKVETKATQVTKTAAVTPTKVETKPVTATASVATLLKGNITKLDSNNVVLKDNAGKEWTFKVGTISLKDYKVGDNVEVNYEKDNLRSIAKATTKK